MKKYILFFLVTSCYIQAMEKSSEYKILPGLPGLSHGPIAYKQYKDGKIEPIFTTIKEQEKKENAEMKKK